MMMMMTMLYIIYQDDDRKRLRSTSTTDHHDLARILSLPNDSGPENIPVVTGEEYLQPRSNGAPPESNPLVSSIGIFSILICCFVAVLMLCVVDIVWGPRPRIVQKYTFDLTPRCLMLVLVSMPLSIVNRWDSGFPVRGSIP